MNRTHQNALADRQIPPDAKKHKFGITCSDALFVESAPVPLKHEKLCVDVSWPGSSRMQYMTRRTHGLQKHKFGITCPGTLFMETTLGQPEHEK
jgi:hypothetical protein